MTDLKCISIDKNILCHNVRKIFKCIEVMVTFLNKIYRFGPKAGFHWTTCPWEARELTLIKHPKGNRKLLCPHSSFSLSPIPSELFAWMD